VTGGRKRLVEEVHNLYAYKNEIIYKAISVTDCEDP
jgi:hypothetical protein